MKTKQNQRKKNSRRTCGIFIFNEHKELLVTLPFYSDDWEIPIWHHSNNESYLQVAKRGALELVNVDFFNHKDEYFKELRHVSYKGTILCPYVIKDELGVDNVKCWANIRGSDDPVIDDWDFVSVKEANTMLSPLHKLALKQIKI